MAKNRQKGWGLAIYALIGILMVSSLVACQGGITGKPETLTIAMVPTEINALLYVAQDQNIFASNSLQVTFKEDYDSGASAAVGMLNGEAELASASEFPIVRQVFNKKDIIDLGTIARYENTYIIWHVDSGIQTMKDLKGKKIGITLQTISAFYLGRMLDLNGVNIQQVNLVDVKAPDAEKAITNRDVDAVVTWEPWVTQISQHLGQGVITQSLQNNQDAYWNLVSTGAWIKKHSDAARRLLKSLAQAEDFIEDHQDKAKEIVRKRMKFDEAYLEHIWPRYQFSLSLDQSLILAMEDQARWMIDNKLTTEKKMPSFLDYIYEDALERIKPDEVNIIR